MSDRNRLALTQGSGPSTEGIEEEPGSQAGSEEPSQEEESEGEMNDDYYRELFETYFPALTYYFMKRGLEREAAKDLAQDVMLSAYKGLGGFREESQVSTWIYRIADHLFLNHRRYSWAQKRRGGTVSLDETGPAEPVEKGRAHPLREVLAKERLARVRRIIDRFPPRMRQCVLLRYDQDLKYREIADIMGVTVSTVKSQLKQARQRLGVEDDD